METGLTLIPKKPNKLLMIASNLPGIQESTFSTLPKSMVNPILFRLWRGWSSDGWRLKKAQCSKKQICCIDKIVLGGWRTHPEYERAVKETHYRRSSEFFEKTWNGLCGYNFLPSAWPYNSDGRNLQSLQLADSKRIDLLLGNKWMESRWYCRSPLYLREVWTYKASCWTTRI